MKKLKNFSKKTVLVITGMLLGSAFSVFAVSWQGLETIKPGAIISASTLKANLDYLYDKVGGVHNDTVTFRNLTVNGNISAPNNKLECRTIGRDHAENECRDNTGCKASGNNEKCLLRDISFLKDGEGSKGNAKDRNDTYYITCCKL